MVLMKIANVQEMVFIDKSIIHVVSHLYTWYQSCKMVVPQVILNFKWSSNEECIPHYKSSSLANGWPMLWHRERCPTDWYQGQRSYEWYLKSYPNGVIPTYEVMSIKMQDSSVNHLPKCNLLYQVMHTFYRNWWQRGRDWYKDMKYARGIREKLDLDMDMDKEGATLRNGEGSKFFDKRST